MSDACPELGLVLTIGAPAPAAEDRAEAMDADLRAALEAGGLVMRRGSGPERRYFVTRDGDQVTNADREAILRWAQRWAALAAVAVSDIVDLSNAD